MNGKKDGKKSLVKRKSLFDHINQITATQNPNYWDEISDEDKKSWSNYMVNRFLSMNSDWMELVNELQKYNFHISLQITSKYTQKSVYESRVFLHISIINATNNIESCSFNLTFFYTPFST